jgi:hypothetical protein
LMAYFLIFAFRSHYFSSQIKSHSPMIFPAKTNQIRNLVSLFLFLILPFSAFCQAQVPLVVAYAGGNGTEKFHSILSLSDGTFLVGGQAEEFSWVPNGVPVNVINFQGDFASSSSLGKGFVMHLSEDLQTINSILRFPDNSVRDVYKIKTNSLPGDPTGDIFISGSRDNQSGVDGYYIAKLNGNFLNGIPSGLAYYKVINAKARSGGAPIIQFPPGLESSHKQTQPWDVNAKGQVLYAMGSDFSFDTAAVYFMNRNGVDTLMPFFGNHSSNFSAIPLSPSQNGLLKSSFLFFRYNGTTSPGAWRSFSKGLFDQNSEDENGNSGRKGAYPFDAFFNSYQALGGASIDNSGSGYTGYSPNVAGGRWSGKIGGICFDKRSGDFFIGASISVSGRNSIANVDDTEPAVAAFSSNGEQKWWARLHKEDANGSSAQQQVEGLEFDYSGNQLVVLGRSRSDAANNFWKGNELKLKLGGNGFQNRITGSISNSNIPDFFWLGKYDAVSGRILHSTYIAEPDSNEMMTIVSGGNAGNEFPDINKGNFKLGSTTVSHFSVNPLNGDVLISGTGLRTITTSNAYQKMLLPGIWQEGKGIAPRNSFARVYTGSLDSLRYSSLISGLWNPAEGNSDNTTIRSLLPISGGILFAGYHSGSGSDVQVMNPPSWGNSTANGVSALLGKLPIRNAEGPSQPDLIIRPSDFCSGTQFTFSIPAVSGASSYKWVVEGNGWSGTSSSNSITLIRETLSDAGFLTVYAINQNGISRPRMTTLPGSGQSLSAPLNPEFPAAHCVGQTKYYGVDKVANASSYSWTITGNGCNVAWSTSSNSSSLPAVQITSNSSISTACSLQVVAQGCGAPSQVATFEISPSSSLPLAPVFVGSDNSICAGIPKSFSVLDDSSGAAYLWEISGNGFSVSEGFQANTDVTSILGSGVGTLSVSKLNACGAGPKANLSILAPLNQVIPSIPDGINGPNFGFCFNNTIQYSVAAQPNTSYEWFTNGSNWQVTPGTNAGTANLFVPQFGSSTQAFVFVQAKNACGISNPVALQIRKGKPDILTAERIKPSLDSGICVGSTITFFINPTFSATSYQWIFPNGWIINGPANSNEVSVTVSPSAESGTIKVRAFNSCGYDSVFRSSPVIKTISTSFGISPSSGNLSLCQGTSIMAHITGSFATTVGGFQWIMPSGIYVADASQAEPNFDTVRISTSYEAISGPGMVIMSGGQCANALINAQVSEVKLPAPILGQVKLCDNPPNGSYSIKPLQGANAYEFLLEPENAGTLVVTDTIANINWANDFNGQAVLKAKARFSCNTSPAGPPLNISVGNSKPWISGLSSMCRGESIQLSAPTATGYLWSNGATSQSISVFLPGPYQVRTFSPSCTSRVSTVKNVVFKQGPELGIIQVGESDTLRVSSIPPAIFQWYFNGNLMVGKTDSFLVAAGSGNYLVVGIHTNTGCSDSSSLFYNFTQLDRKRLTAVKVYPNPSENGIFEVDISASNISEISVTDMMGRVISTPFFTGSRGKVDLSKFPTGIYMLRIQSELGLIRSYLKKN